MTILRVLVFILVQGCVVCDELYPISVLSDITEDQLEGFSANNQDDVELSQAKSSMSGDPDIIDLAWIEENIVNHYGFVKKSDRDEWKTLPTFEGVLKDNHFIDAADRVKKFFARNNDWETTKNNPKFRKNGGCTELLYITAARYLYVTRILYLQSDGKLIPCEEKEDGKTQIPVSGVCYPAPPSGSATCTSDYDASLVGKDTGFLIEKFNNYFQDGVNGFKKPSDLVFDVNVYAFTTAYAFPVNYVGLPANFVPAVEEKKKTVDFKMQELASAYFKVFKYNKNFFDKMKTEALKAMNENMKASEYGKELDKWLKAFSNLDGTVKMRSEYFDSPLKLREAHNAEYQKHVKEMSQKGGYDANLLGTLAMAELYAAEAYHTRGAIKHVVGGMQMKVDTPLTAVDLWVSMIENWGESNKEYNHCKNDPMEQCLLKMSKYMGRMFNAMRLVFAEHIPLSNRLKLLHLTGVENFSNPEFAFKTWLGYKKDGKTAIPPENIDGLKECLRQFQCDQAVQQAGSSKPLPAACISKINDKVNDYNVRLAGLVADIQ